MKTIYSIIQSELDDFFKNKVHISGVSTNDIRNLSRRNTNYDFSQWEMVNLIDSYYNSKFETGLIDSEGQRKIFLNVCKFRADVASKQIDLDVKNWQFLPDEGTSEWVPFFLQREFKQWAKENYFGELVNTCVEMFPRYGWVVLKKIKGGIEFVPLQTLRNQQDAKSLQKAKYVIIEHPEMTLSEMKEMKEWNTDKLDMEYDETVTVYERYGHVSKKQYAEYTGEKVAEGEEDESVDCLTICTMKKSEKGKEPEGTILFMEELSERPFVECHWAQQHGRLMGVGEIENQLENQVGTNMAFNLYRRQLLWSSKKIFQSPNSDMAKNLVRDVKDGDVLEVGVNGDISQVDMGNRAGGDFSNFQTILEKNSDQKSFTYESATGESLPSGTPFRLGVLLTNAVNSHFDLKREKLGLMFKRGTMDLVIPQFKKEFSEKKIITMFSDEEGYELIKQFLVISNVNEIIKKMMLSGKNPNPDLIRQKVEADLARSRTIKIEIPEDFYTDAKLKVTLTITGEEVDVPKKIETLTNLYTTLSQKQDPRADKVLSRILSYTGENFDIIAGPAPVQAPPEGSIPSPIQQSSLNQPTTPNTQL